MLVQHPVLRLRVAAMLNLLNPLKNLVLTDNKEVSFELRGEIPGLKCIKGDGEAEWTPVVRRRREKSTNRSRNSSSNDAIDVQHARDVHYEERNSIPGLYVRQGCTMSSVSWTTVKPSPISSRTRTRFKQYQPL